MRRLLLIVLILTTLAACRTEPEAPPRPTVIVFPTVTPGQEVHGILGTPPGRLPAGAIANPATAAVLANQPSATPDTGDCPSIDDTLRPDLEATLPGEIGRFLTIGGSLDVLEQALREDWNILGENGLFRPDIDLTGDLVPEIVLSYTAQNENEGGVLAIYGCEAGRYIQRFSVTSDAPTPPQILLMGDVNNDLLTDIVYTVRRCNTENDCPYRTQVISWQPEEWRFASLVETIINSDTLPQVTDTDDDTIGEIVVRMESNGTSVTGPLRTGVLIYDWNGSGYVLSIRQLNQPRYRIQVIHEADRNFARREMEAAISLYQLALTDEDLRAWRDDEDPILESYALYRLLLAQAYSGDLETTEAVYQRILTTFAPQLTVPEIPPEGENQEGAEAPPEAVEVQPEANAFDDPALVYVAMSQAFWNSYQIVANLGTACSTVLPIADARPEAIDWLNRYGTRNPVYTNRDLCPF